MTERREIVAPPLCGCGQQKRRSGNRWACSACRAARDRARIAAGRGVCADCGAKMEPPTRARARWHCENCRIASTQHDKRFRERVGAERPKYLARKAVENALASGALRRAPCEVCGRGRAHAHHDDYDRQLDVRWLCPLHHRQVHRGQPATVPARISGRAA